MKTLILVLAAVFSNACEKSYSVAEVSENPVITPRPIEPESLESVDFEGVSFRYDSGTFGKVKPEVVPAYRLQEPDFKPDFVEPEHVRFTFDFGGNDRNAGLSVYRLHEFPDMYSVNPDSVERLKKEIAGLQRVLKDHSYRLDGEIPHLPFADASQDLLSKVRHFNFENGKGILFVMHWSNEYTFISNRNLIYRFEGITNDGEYYVTAEMPVIVDFLPHDTSDEIDGYKWIDLLDESEAGKKRRKAYLEGITTRLEKLNSNEFRPNLEKFESVISSLKVNK